jgi:ATP-dependent helicase/nuclease subunit A
MSDDPVCGDLDKDEFSLTPQQRAALELGHNIAITAGAGTGKTTTLTERYRSILHSSDTVGPKEILTLTFTNDATSEMQEQIREVVDEELNDTAPTEYNRWRDIKDEIGDAYIHTIHGFCSRILREFAVEAGVHPEFETLDEGEAETVIDEAITTVLDWYGRDVAARTASREPLAAADAVKTDWDLPEALETLTNIYSRHNIESALTGLFNERPDSITWAQHCSTQTPEEYLSWVAQHIDVPITRKEADELIKTEKAQAAIEEILELRGLELPFGPADDDGAALLKRLTAILSETAAHQPDGDSVDRQRFLLAVADGVTTNDGEWTSNVWQYAGSGGRWSKHDLSDEQDRFQAAVESLGELIEPEARDLGYDPIIALHEAEQAIALARVFECVRTEYDQLKQQRNALDYSDLIGKATQFLANNETARETLRDQFAYIMVDEVQDTDPRQWRLIKLLSGDSSDHFDGQNVFLVGDEKQSIYRFRDADVTRFSDARDRLLADNPDSVRTSGDGDLELSGNFRTLEKPLTVINELFDQVFRPAAADPTDSEETESGERLYEPYEATPQPLSACRTEGTDIDGSVEYLIVPSDEDADAAFGLANSWFTNEPFVSKAEREAKAVAARLTQLFETTRIYDPDDETYRIARPQDVALLFRSSGRLAAFERELEKAKIPYTNLAGGSFYDTPEIRPLINLLRVFEDPTADIPLYGVLRSPLFGFEDTAIARARESETPLWESLTNATPELQAARDRLEEWRTTAGLEASAGVSRWSMLLSQIIDDTGYLVSVGADERSQQAVANVEQFRSQLRNWEEGSARSISALLDQIKQERESDADPSEATIPGDVEGVQLRTIHSAKGLEFPVVIIPEITRGFNFQSSLPKAHFERIDDDPILGMKTPSRTNQYSKTDTATYAAVRRQYQRREQAEKRRLLYVAATRTRDHLLLTGTHSVDPETTTGLETAGEWEDAKTWQDWIQPLLLDEPNLVSTLAADSTTTRGLGEAAYEIRRPTSSSDWEPPASDTTIPSDIEIPEPPTHPTRRRLSATMFRDQLKDAPTRPAVLRATANSTAADHSSIDDTAAIDALGDATVGTIVHRLCELQPPESQWSTVIRRHVDKPESIDDSILEAITAHAEAGVAGLDEIESRYEIVSRHTEVPVTLDHQKMQVSGDIDHLSVTNNGYLIVDYKTSDLSGQSIDHLTKHYLTQLVAYAGALKQADPSATTFDIALVFTDTGATRSRKLTRSDVKELLEWAGKLIR